MKRRIIVPVLVLSLGMLIAGSGCERGKLDAKESGDGDRTTVHQGHDKYDSGEGIRTDLEPLLERTSLAKGAESASWMAGTMANPRIPGPDAYWIDVVATMDDTTIKELNELSDWVPVQLPEGFRTELSELIPEGQLLKSQKATEKYTEGKWQCVPYLVADTNIVAFQLFMSN